ncbi:hypothetical protein AvCA_05010 [Azotobacter vinelandii CA]|uniref:Uncharacterized protein n=2 Tax=Azotobacter vinelandii TaxID=354 RepID=C1DJH0_AZOVD|nr:hypothetical protein [Azotobacter vinelandii]ACO76755.1 hypothetical protein Avin_05010 [Azotobacter vinelandii DJ]AGK15586.1 hypothetical protein AvCA_05010 [Azotobacter vinelandii CA]AGK19344.1 hypothetical protein AvCA6_05010 [Azotobacter vinelandii CA6]WKN22518.1 hypothetical protein AVAEIV_000505 [Azotobacter vinelandii]SFX81456.1 hypothetical protein SAMN04244547_02851 [Azotobacter vinelandii]
MSQEHSRFRAAHDGISIDAGADPPLAEALDFAGVPARRDPRFDRVPVAGGDTVVPFFSRGRPHDSPRTVEAIRSHSTSRSDDFFAWQKKFECFFLLLV